MENNNLFLFRRKARMRQFDLAQKLGITEQAVSGYETGRIEPTIDRALEIARILEVEPKDIFPSLFK
jgi:putative transcriptional regulator